MADENTITFALDGEVSMQDFTEAMKRFNELVKALSTTVGAKKNEVNWLVTELEAGSALATITAYSNNKALVRTIINAYAAVGRSLSLGEPAPYSKRIRSKAEAIIGILSEKITAIRFETASTDSLISAKLLEGRPQIRYAMGSVRGKIEVVSVHGKLKFTLYDTLFGKPVHCYPDEEQREILRTAWDKDVVVNGIVAREPENGYAINIREISRIEIVDIGLSGGFEQARGLITVSTDEESEIVIRRLRETSYAE
jgi:hypothetical protein